MKKRLYNNEIAPITDTHNELLVPYKVITQVNTNYWLLLFANDLCKSCKQYIQIIVTDLKLESILWQNGMR